MNNFFDLFQFVLELIAVIVFFVMAANISVIKNSLKKSNLNHARTVYLQQKILGNNQQAYEALLYVVLDEMRSGREKYGFVIYQSVKKEYEQDFIDIGRPFPEYPFKREF